MDIRRLEVFCKVVELKSFTRAADAVHLSQPSVSEHVRVLEETVGDKLLDRLGREAQVTGAGQVLYRYARRIIALRDEALQAVRSYGGQLTGTLRLGASTIPGAYLLPQRLEAFQAKVPGTKVMLRISGTSKIVEEVLQGELELGLIGALWKDQSLVCQPFRADQLVLTVAPSHPWAQRREVEVRELPSETFILRERGSGTRMVMTQVLAEHGVEVDKLDLCAEMGSTEAVRQGVKAGLGISILSSLAVAEDVRLGTLVNVPLAGVTIERPFYLVHRKNRQLSPLGQAFLAYLYAGDT